MTTEGGTAIADGFTDVKFIGGGRFLARKSALGNDGYKIYDATGQQVSAQEFRYFEPLGEGFFSVPTSTAGIGMSDVIGPDGKVVIRGAFPSYSPAAVRNGTLSYSAGGKTQAVNIHAAAGPVARNSSVSGQPVANPGGILLGKDQKYQSQPGLATETEELLRQIDAGSAATAGKRSVELDGAAGADCSGQVALVSAAERSLTHSRIMLEKPVAGNIKVREYLVAINTEVLDRARVSLVACVSRRQR